MSIKKLIDCIYCKVAYAFIGLLFLLIVKTSYGQSWDSVSSGIGPLCCSEIYSMVLYKGELYAGGTFSLAGGKQCNNIAKWNGIQWSPLGAGVNGWVAALAVYNGNLVVGGTFDSAGGLPTNNIATWNGISWKSILPGIKGISPWIDVMQPYDSILYVGGGFDSAGSNAANNIAQWNGTSWSSLGSGTNCCIYSMATFNKELFVGGGFDSANGIPVKNLVKWTGSKWDTTVRYKFNGVPYSLLADDSVLYDGGPFTLNPQFVGQWNGTSWAMLGNGLNGYCYALTQLNQNIYAGGIFTIGSCNNVGQWDGTNWNLMGSGMNNIVRSLVSYQGYIYAGGDFTQADGGTVGHIAVWNAPLGLNNIDGKPITVYPNPSNGRFSFQLQDYIEKGKIDVYNTLGKLIYSSPILNASFNVNITNSPPDIYFYRINYENGELSISGKLIIQ